VAFLLLKGNVGKGLEYARRGLSLEAENDRLKNLLSQIGGSASGSDDVAKGGGIE
jgi:hypothetical protein